VTENFVQFVCRLFAGVQPKGQQAVDAINDYQSIVSLMNTSLQMALVANRTVQDASPFLSSFAELGAAVNQSVAASRALQQTVAQLNSSLAASGTAPVLVFTAILIGNSVELLWKAVCRLRTAHGK